MSSTRPELPVQVCRLAGSLVSLLLPVLMLLMLPFKAGAQDSELLMPPSNGGPEAWLVTYAPGEIYWQRFGHNAIWIRDPGMGIDHSFNFGYFDFNQENFIARFIQGRMLYFSLAQPAAREFGQYQAENRTISVQRLNLAPQAFENLRDYLLDQVQPGARNYLYDYYLNNCSTRVRDALEIAFDGALSRQTGKQAATQNFRAHTRRSVTMDFWYYLGLESALGLPVDGDNSRWEEMFLPLVVAQVLADLEIDGQPAVSGAQLIFQGSAKQPPPEAPSTWYRYLLFSVLFTAFLLALGRLAGPVMAGGLALAWLLQLATGGAILLGLWTLTDHHVASPNANLLLMNPLFLLGLWPGLRKTTAILICAGMVLATAQALWPSGQYTMDVLAFIAPLNAACACWLYRQRRQVD